MIALDCYGRLGLSLCFQGDCHFTWQLLPTSCNDISHVQWHPFLTTQKVCSVSVYNIHPQKYAFQRSVPSISFQVKNLHFTLRIICRQKRYLASSSSPTSHSSKQMKGAFWTSQRLPIRQTMVLDFSPPDNWSTLLSLTCIATKWQSVKYRWDKVYQSQRSQMSNLLKL